MSVPTGRCRGRSRGGKVWSDVEVDEAVLELGDRRTVLPAHAGVDGEVGQDAPVVGRVGVVDGLAEILVGVAERDRAGVRHAEEEVGKIGAAGRLLVPRPGSGTGEGEGAARILLKEIVELLLAEVAADGDVVVPAIDGGGSGKGVGAAAIEGALRVRQSEAMPLEKFERGGPQ